MIRPARLGETAAHGLALVLLVVLMIGGPAFALGVSPEPARIKEAKGGASISATRATEIAIGAAKAQYGAKGVGGGALDFERASASQEKENWIVYIPEIQPRARPHGRTFQVNAQTGKCDPLIVE